MTATASGLAAPEPRPDPVTVLAEAIDAGIASVAGGLEPASPPRAESGTETPDVGAVVTNVLQDYLTAVGPVQMELTVERQFEGANGPLAPVMTQLGVAFRCFHAGEYAQGLAALRTRSSRSTCEDLVGSRERAGRSGRPNAPGPPAAYCLCCGTCDGS